MQDSLSDDAYAQIEQSIYEAAVVSEKWPDVLQTISQLGESVGGVLFSVSDYGSQWTASPPFRSVTERFITNWAERNTRMATGFRKGLHLIPRFVTEDDYYEPGDLEQEVIYREFFYPEGLGYSAGTIATLPHGDMICLSVEKPLAEGPISATALARLDSLRPHLVRAAMMTARLGFERIRTAVDTLTQLGFAAAAVNMHGKVMIANPMFEVESVPWTTRGGDRIALLDRGADLLLRSALEAISGVAGVRSIPLRPVAGPPQHILHVVPVRRTAHDLFARASAILVITTSAAKAGEPPLLQALFDLTPAEAALANRIGEGRTIEQIAAEGSKSLHTLRNQLKTVLAKTGTHRQTELAVMLARLVPPAL